MERSQRAFAVGIAIGLVFFTTALGFAVYTSVTLQVGAGFTALQAGLAFAPAGVAFFGASLLAPKLVPRLGRYVLSLGYAVLCLGMLATALTIQLAGPSLTVWTLAPALLIVGTGQGLGMSPLIGSVLSGIRHQDTGSAAGALTTSFQLGQTLGIAVVGMIFFPLVGHVSANGPVGSYLYAYQISVLTLAGLAVLLFLLVFLLPQPASASLRSDALLERSPNRSAGLAHAFYLVTGGHGGEWLMNKILSHHLRDLKRHEATLTEADELS